MRKFVKLSITTRTGTGGFIVGRGIGRGAGASVVLLLRLAAAITVLFAVTVVLAFTILFAIAVTFFAIVAIAIVSFAVVDFSVDFFVTAAISSSLPNFFSHLRTSFLSFSKKSSSFLLVLHLVMNLKRKRRMAKTSAMRPEAVFGRFKIFVYHQSFT